MSGGAFARKWAGIEQVVVYDELHELLTRAACSWAGVPLAETQVKQRTREVALLFDAAGSVEPRHWWARLARNRVDCWIETVITEIRNGQVRPPPRSVAHVIAHHRELNGDLLNARIAAVELLHVIRPIFGHFGVHHMASAVETDSGKTLPQAS